MNEISHDVKISDHVRGLIGADDDVIGRQYVPSNEERDIKPDEMSDPIGDERHSPVSGIVHRYPDRVLFKVVNICAVYCRYCFRKDMIGVGADNLSEDDFDRAIEYIKYHNEIWEVILTGGDPLILSARRLQKIMDALGQIDHVKVIRIHTRIPIADPVKITDTLLSVLESVSKPVYVVVHVNNTREITSDVEAVILSLRGSGCSILSQSVLLKGVNDDAEILEKLFKKLITLHVKPYYLHHLDRAKGTSHFRVSIGRGQEIMKELQGRVSGICLPKYMLDIPEGHGKIPINGCYINAVLDGAYSVEDYQGHKHNYKEF